MLSRKKYQKSLQMAYQVDPLILLGRLEIHIALSYLNFDVSSRVQGKKTAEIERF